MSTNSRVIRRLQTELKLFQQQPVANIQLFPKHDDLFRWYFILTDLPHENYKDGEYIGYLDIPIEYPFKQPTVMILTPNGRFPIWETICTMLIDPKTGEQWSPRWNLQTLVLSFLSYMLENEKKLDKKKQKLAKQSHEYNRTHHADILNSNTITKII